MKILSLHDWKSYLFTGILLLTLGIFILSMPVLASTTMIIILGWLLLTGGILQFILIYSRKASSDKLSLLFAFISAIGLITFGGLLLYNPIIGTITLALLFSIYLVIQGCSQIFLSFALRPLIFWWWMFISGSVAILIAIFIWLNWPTNAAAFLGIVIGIYLLIWGIAECMLAISIRKSQH